jgi:hypothetical protein
MIHTQRPPAKRSLPFAAQRSLTRTLASMITRTQQAPSLGQSRFRDNNLPQLCSESRPPRLLSRPHGTENAGPGTERMVCVNQKNELGIQTTEG